MAAFPCPPKEEIEDKSKRKCIAMSKCTPNIAFLCPPRATAEKKMEALINMKEVISRLEEELRVSCEPRVTSLTCSPCCVPSGCVPPTNIPIIIPPGCVPCCPNAEPSCPPCCPAVEEEVCEPPDVMVCYKLNCDASGKKKKKGKAGRSGVIRVKKSKSRELRASILYTGCQCEKRNGLQDQCPRTDCQGSPACLTQPDPTCGPSEFASGKHMEKIYGKFRKTVGLQKGANVGTEEEEGEDGYVEEEYQCFPAYIKGTDDNCCCPVSV